MQWGLGPVFSFEWLTISRRWQVYAGRSFFVAILLAGLAVVWSSEALVHNSGTIRGQARVGQAFFQAIAGIQLTLVMLAAPAATAGSVCVDKARGTLSHILVTDLSSAEIVLGKLAARLVPVVGLMACTLPVVALGTLLGGIDPVALAGAFLVAIGMAVLGCAITLALSVWGKRSHDVLLSTYALWIVWLLAVPTCSVLAWEFGFGSGSPLWLEGSNPFWLTFGPTIRPGSLGLKQQAIFLMSALVISASVMAFAALRIRATAARQGGRDLQRVRRRWPRAIDPRRRFRWLRGPSLDGNPVLWREYHRQRPSDWSRIVWGLYAAGSFAFTGLIVGITWNPIAPGSEIGAVINGFQALIGLLLLSVSSATALAEERRRGSLDLLMVTPLSTRSIVWGKWWGSYRVVPWLSALPGLVAMVLSRDRRGWIGAPLVIALVLAYGAALTSLGLALATWVPRLGRAVSLTVAAYILIAVGAPFLAMALDSTRTTRMEGLACASPFWGVGYLTDLIHQGRNDDSRWLRQLPWTVGWIVTFGSTALLLLIATLMTFDRSLGRITATSTQPTHELADAVESAGALRKR